MWNKVAAPRLQTGTKVSVINWDHNANNVRALVQELCEGRGGRPGLTVLTSLLISVDVKIY